MKRAILTFADAEVQTRVRKSKHFLFKIEKVVDWERLGRILSKTDYRLHNKTGRDNYSPLIMFKIMLIQRYYDLSDREIENDLMYNMAYVQFCGISLDHPIPDHSTIARWRQRFIDFKCYDDVFADFDKQLEEKGYKVKPGLIVDATLIEAYARPRNQEIVDVEPVGDDDLKEQTLITTDNLTKAVKTTLTKTTSIDPDAEWLKKGKRSVYGYKFHAVVNDDGLFVSGTTTPANVYDGNMLEAVLEPISVKTQEPLYGDKGYDANDNRELLSKKGMTDMIMRKKPKNKDFDEDQLQRNKDISRVRYKIERSFGLFKKRLKSHKTKYIGLEKTHNYNILGAFAHNLIRCLTL